jgi:hypothetical protein
MNVQEHVFSKMHIQQVQNYVNKNNINDVTADEDDDLIDDDLDQNVTTDDENDNKMWQNCGNSGNNYNDFAIQATRMDYDNKQNGETTTASGTASALKGEYNNDSLNLSNIEHLMHQQYNYNQMRGE